MNKTPFLLILTLAPICCFAASYTCKTPGGIVIHQFEPCKSEKARSPNKNRERGPIKESQPTSKSARDILKKGFQDFESGRREIREGDPDRAKRICTEAKAKEQMILAKDPQAELIRSIDLFELRGLQDVYCEEFEEKNLSPYPLRTLPPGQKALPEMLRR